MILITNGKEIAEVTRGAYDTIFKHLGYSVMGSEEIKEARKQEKVDIENADDFEKQMQGEEPENETEHEASIEEKPVSEWSAKELKEFAKEKGVDIKGKKADELRGVVADILATM